MWIRIANDKACKWCQSLSGQGEHYRDIDFRRHANCRCQIINTSEGRAWGSGGKKGVWTEQAYFDDFLSKIKKKYSKKTGQTATPVKPIKKYNLRDPDDIAGVKYSNTMTRDKANKGHVNPEFSRGGGYTINCQSCVVTYEARLRGYSVKTKPRTSTSTTAGRLARGTNLAWIDSKTGLPPVYTEIRVNTAKQLMKEVESTIKENCRYTIEFSWKGRSRSGHIVSIDRDKNGKLRLYDPQIGKEYIGDVIKQYFNKVGLKGTLYGRTYQKPVKILRIDDKIINKDIADDIMEKS